MKIVSLYIYNVAQEEIVLLGSFPSKTNATVFLGDNHCLPFLHMAKHFTWIEETGKRINDFEIGYMINPSFHVNKTLKNKWKSVCILYLVNSHDL